MAIKTHHLDYDDRLRKESRSLAALGVDVEIMVLEQKNEAAALTVYGGIPARTVALKTRTKYPSGQKLWLKTGELYFRLFHHLLRSRPDIIWIHDMTFAALIPLLALWRAMGMAKGLVWDQHELPPDSLLARERTRRLLAWLMNRCQVIIAANEERRQILEERLGKRLRTPIISLENYPDALFVQSARRALPTELQDWLDGKPYFLAQGGGHGRWRHLDELVAAMMALPAAKLIVLGGYDPAKVAWYRQKYGASFDERIRFVDFVPQLDVPIYIDAALASVVFYEMRNLNWIYCAPNRLYQALARGVPVVVGENPPMKSLVEQYQCGVVVDASSVERVGRALRQILERESFYRQRAQQVSERFVWETQTPRLQQILARVGVQSVAQPLVEA
ncbi:MAG: glycosyltransferase family 4 protein [Chloroflexi bacterium]|nr:glycosyltransferase family 4 protein [Chloroflexota bacterium]